MELSSRPGSLFESLAGLRSLADSGLGHPAAKGWRTVGGLGQVASGGVGRATISTPLLGVSKLKREGAKNGRHGRRAAWVNPSDLDRDGNRE